MGRLEVTHPNCLRRIAGVKLTHTHRLETTVESRGIRVCILGLGVPSADPVRRRGTGHAGGAPKCVPAATQGVHTGPGVDRGGAAAPPLLFDWSSDSSGHHACLAAVMVIQLSN
eukprot:363970-Chlamydomonas_euryale.AAC.4